jgi:hypothetical protein
VKDGYSYFYEMSPEIFYMSILGHSAYHFAESAGVGIRHLADVYLFRKAHALNEEYLNNELEKCGLLQFKVQFEKLADYFFEAGEYKKSLEMIQRSLRDANQVQQAVNESYLWFLSGLAKISLSQTQEAAPQPHDIEDIYSDFESSLRLGVRSSLRDSICKKAALLRHKHNVEIPSQCSRLFELLDDGQMLD